MLDVHAPHRKGEGFKDFLLHLLTITIGLLIALGLEGLVEWRQHRKEVREAEAGMKAEISHNGRVIGSLQTQIAEQQKALDNNLQVLKQMRADPARNGPLSFAFGLQSFNDVAWKTAQSTGAMSYMDYQSALMYSDIYGNQAEVFAAEKETVSDVLRAASFPSTQDKAWKPTTQQIDELTDRIGELRMRLLLLNSLATSLDRSYRDFQAKEKQ